jgi:CubicO group peptidase (beta-lactamase class C family)
VLIAFQRYVFGHWGAGGQVAYSDPCRKVGWAYITNFSNLLHGYIVDHRYAAVEKALFQCLDELDRS